MFKISMVTLALALASISVFAAPEVSEHERALRKASKWSDLTAQLKGRLPSNVVKEFAEFAKDEEFPSARRIKNKLVITETDGTKVIVEYKKNGAISLNGKEWKLRPLATVEEEVSRLALFINGETKASGGFFGLVPAAQAGGAAVGGAAIAAFAGANAWKAESCGEVEISGDLVNDCPLMGVGMQPILVSTKQLDPEEFYPVDLKCPKEREGTIELISKRVSGQAERLKVKYSGDKPVSVTIEAAEKGGKFSEIFPHGNELSEEDKVAVKENVVQKIDSLRNGVCLGPKKERSRYFAMLSANATDLRGNSSSPNDKDEKSAVEAL